MSWVRKLQLLTSYTLLFFCISCSSRRENQSEKTIFRYNQSGGLTSLDPAFASSQANIWLVTQLFEGLVELDNELKVKPALAESWCVDSTGTVYLFDIRKGVSFHDHPIFKQEEPRYLNAYDFEYSFRRIIDTTDIYNKGIWIFKDKVLRKEDGSLSDTCFKALNDSVFQICLNKPVSNFLEILAMPYAYVVPQEVAEYYKKDFRSHPVGTGPFKFFLWEEGNSLVLHKNENYWRKVEGVRVPYLDAVQVSFVPDKSQAYREFLIGELDYFSGIDQSSVDEILNLDGSFSSDITDQFTVLKCDYLNTEYLGFQLDSNANCYKNDKEAAFLDVNLRKALSWSIDKEKMVRFVKNNLGVAGVHGFVPPAVPHFDEEHVKGYNINEDSAQFFWSRVREKPREISIHITKEHKALTEYLAKEWMRVLGVETNIEVHEAGVLRQMANNGDAAFFRASWLGDYPDAENYLSVFYGGNFTPTGPNKTHFISSTFDSLFDLSYSINDIEKRKIINERLDRELMSFAPAIFLYYDEVLQLSSKNLQDLTPNGMNVLKLREVRKFGNN